MSGIGSRARADAWPAVLPCDWPVIVIGLGDIPDRRISDPHPHLNVSGVPADSARMEVGVTAIGSPAAGAFYDARRGVYYTKPVLRGWLHVLWFEASLVLGPLLGGPRARSHADHRAHCLRS